jgi:hypothetical protein
MFEQAVWGIGNLAATNTIHRDAIIRKGAILKIIKVVKRFRN